MDDIISAFLDNKINYAIVMPDSMNKKLVSLLIDSNQIKVIMCTNEIEAITISSGLNLAGIYTVVIMENSGLRSIADIITRFELSHHIHNIFLITNRGILGEANWWGIMHQKISKNILDELHILSTDVNRICEFCDILKKSIQSFKSEQISVAINLTEDFFKELL